MLRLSYCQTGLCPSSFVVRRSSFVVCQLFIPCLWNREGDIEMALSVRPSFRPSVRPSVRPSFRPSVTCVFSVTIYLPLTSSIISFTWQFVMNDFLIKIEQPLLTLLPMELHVYTCQLSRSDKIVACKSFVKWVSCKKHMSAYWLERNSSNLRRLLRSLKPWQLRDRMWK